MVIDTTPAHSPRQIPIQSAARLIAYLDLRQTLVEIQALVGLSGDHYHVLYEQPIRAFIECAQLAPASQTHHHARPGGLAIHTIELIQYALKLRKGAKLPVGAGPEEMLREAHRWTYAVFAGALLHDVGKLISNFRLSLHLANGANQVWTPLSGNPVRQQSEHGATHYSIDYQKTDYRLHNRLGLSCFDLLPGVGRGWLAQSSEIMAQLSSLLSGDLYESGSLGRIVTEADRHSVAKDLKLDKAKFETTGVSLIEQLMRGLRHLIAEDQVKLNRSGAMGWVTEKYTYLVCRPVTELLVSHLTREGVTGIPADFIRIYDTFLEHGYAVPCVTNEAGAIWKIEVCGNNDSYRHVLTCLVFETQRLFLPTRKVPIFEGSVDVTEAETTSRAGVESETVSGDEPETIPRARVESDASDADEDAPSLDPFAEEIAPAAGKRSEDGASTHANEADTESEERASSVSEEAATKGGGESTESGTTPSWDSRESGAIAEAFIAWIKAGLLEKALPFNKPSAVLHVVDEGVLVVSPVAFKQFCERHGLVEPLLDQCEGDRDKALSAAANRLQRHVARLKLNVKAPVTGQNVHTYWAGGNNRKSRLNGWLFPHNVFYSDPSKIPQSNKYIQRDRDNQGERRERDE